MVYQKKTAKEKLYGAKGLPKMVKIIAKMAQKAGKGKKSMPPPPRPAPRHWGLAKRLKSSCLKAGQK